MNRNQLAEALQSLNIGEQVRNGGWDGKTFLEKLPTLQIDNHLHQSLSKIFSFSFSFFPFLFLPFFLPFFFLPGDLL